jgi:hypothetical protein
MADGRALMGSAYRYWYMINSRDKGKRFELKIAKVWMRLFGGDVERTSYASKKLDDMGVDLTNTDPFNIQCKAVESSMNYHQILERMPHKDNINLVIHKRNHQPPVAAMYLEDLLELLTAMKREGIL